MWKTSERTVSQLCIHERVEFLPTVGFCQETLYFSRSFQAVVFRCNAITLRKLCSEQGFYLAPYTLTPHSSFQHFVQFTAVLKEWIQTVGPAASYECLAQALQHPIVRRSELATKYCHECIETGENRIFRIFNHHNNFEIISSKYINSQILTSHRNL